MSMTKEDETLDSSRIRISESEIEEAVQDSLNQESEEGFTVNVSCSL